MKLIFSALVPLVLSIGIIPAFAVDHEVMSPYQQIKKGIAAKDVECIEDRYLMIRDSGTAACVKASTIKKTEPLGWVLQLNQEGIDITNWTEPPNRHWAVQNSQIFNTRTLDNGNPQVEPFNVSLQDLSDISVDYQGKTMQLDEFLKATHTDGLLVLKDNTIVYENYLRMNADDRHNWHSATKTTSGLLIGKYIEDGTIDPEKKVKEYLPNIGTAYSDATVQEVLDMNVPQNYQENYGQKGGTFSKFLDVYMANPNVKKDFPDGVESYLQSLNGGGGKKTGETQYKTTNTEVVRLVIEAATGEDYGDLLEERIYKHLGAEQDALMWADSTGAVLPGGGLITTLRDMARYGQVIANEGVAPDGTQVISESWINELRTDSKGTTYEIPHYQYYNQIMSNGNVLFHHGVMGQYVFADPETNVVVVKFSSITMQEFLDSATEEATNNTALKISQRLSNLNT